MKLGGVVTLEALLSAFYVAPAAGRDASAASARPTRWPARRRLLRCRAGRALRGRRRRVVALTFAPQLVDRRAAGARGPPAARRPHDRDCAALRGVGDAGARGRAGALGGPGRGDGRPRLRPHGARVDPPARRDHRGADPRRAARRLRSACTACSTATCRRPARAAAAAARPWPLVAGAGCALGGRRAGRTRYRPDPWALPEWLVVACGGGRRGRRAGGSRIDPAR